MNLDTAQPLYLNGTWKISSETLEVTNPANGSTVGKMSTCTRPEVAQAISDAAAAWGQWRSLTAKERGGYLHRMADYLEEHAEELAQLITLENGKPLAQSKGEAGMTVDHFHWFGEEAKRAYGRVVPHQKPGNRHLVFKSPVGIVGAIAPWNFPVVLAARKAAPALAAGCPVILKPASATPLSSVFLAKAAEAAELPPGVFQLVAGSSKEIAGEMLENPACRKITFTGSTKVGRELMKNAADQIKNLSLELGGHAPFLVFEEADLDQAVEGILIAKFRNTGQSCIAANRVYVQRSIYDSFLEKLVKRTQELKIGDGFTDGVEIGPLIDQKSLDHALNQIEQGKTAGATIQCGGSRWGEEGYFLEPTVLTDLPETADCLNEETFAPIAPVVPFDDEAEVIKKANDTKYGLAAYIYTTSLSRAWRVGEKLEAGTIGVNEANPATSQCPFGGFKQSGLGRELGSEGLEAYLETKHLNLGGID